MHGYAQVFVHSFCTHSQRRFWRIFPGLHLLYERPQCPCCGQRELFAHPTTVDVGALRTLYFFQSADNLFAKITKFFQKTSFRDPPAPFGSGVGLFLRPSTGETSTDVAVAWWSRPDEPASRNRPQAKGIY